MLKFAIRDPKRCEVIPNGVIPPKPTISREEALRRVGINDDGDFKVIGQVASLKRFKGHTTLIEAAKLVIDEIPNVYFVNVGYVREDSSFPDELKQQIDELGLRDRFKLVSYPGPIGDLWQLFDQHVHASWFDSMPQAIIEAMSLTCLLYTSPSPRDKRQSRMPSSA